MDITMCRLRPKPGRGTRRGAAALELHRRGLATATSPKSRTRRRAATGGPALRGPGGPQVAKLPACAVLHSVSVLSYCQNVLAQKRCAHVCEEVLNDTIALVFFPNVLTHFSNSFVAVLSVAFFQGARAAIACARRLRGERPFVGGMSWPL